jgi:tRNA(Ile)-lysidine synthase
MHLLAGFARRKKLPPPVVLTVDHGLRKGSARDALRVAAWAKAAGLTAHILRWRGAKPKSGIEAAARAARYRLMGDWLVKHKITTLHVGHTRDDQAETFLLRLARGSGLDGLSAMRPLSPWPVPSSEMENFAGLRVARPLLETGRAELRDYLAGLGQPWLEDPMNEDASFDRVRIRKARAALEQAGLSAQRIAAAAVHLGRARAALEVVTGAVLARATHPVPGGGGALLLDPVALTAAPREISLRALAAILGAVSGSSYRPRFESLERLLGRIAALPLRGGATLQGCHILAAAKDQRHFGPATLAVRPEGPRKSPAKTGSSASAAARKR